jgi:hypothetical protein
VRFAFLAFSPFSLAALAVLSPAVLSGCSSGASSKPDFPDPDVTGRDVNPDGTAYPTDNVGAAKRAGTRRGQRFPNLTFQGYVDGDRSKGLSAVSLADYFDPQMKRNKVLHLQIAATWCAICSSEVSATVPVTAQMREEGAVFLEIIVSGPAAGKGPALEEVDDWVTKHGTNFTTAIDVRARRLGVLGVDPSLMPHDVLIDTRTMEILDSSVGAPVDIVKYVRTALNFVKANPPSY